MPETTYEDIERLELLLADTKKDFLRGHGWRKSIELLDNWTWEKQIEGRLERVPMDMAIEYELTLQEIIDGKCE